MKSSLGAGEAPNPIKLDLNPNITTSMWNFPTHMHMMKLIFFLHLCRVHFLVTYLVTCLPPLTLYLHSLCYAFTYFFLCHSLFTSLRFPLKKKKAFFSTSEFNEWGLNDNPDEALKSRKGEKYVACLCLRINDDTLFLHHHHVSSRTFKIHMVRPSSDWMVTIKVYHL